MSAGALNNGTIQLWSATGAFGRSAALSHVPMPRAQQPLFGKQTWKYASGAKQILKAAHPTGTEVTDVRLLRDGHGLVSRGAEGAVRLWDIRKLTAGAVHEWALPLPHSHAGLGLSPQEDMLLAGAAASFHSCLTGRSLACMTVPSGLREDIMLASATTAAH